MLWVIAVSQPNNHCCNNEYIEQTTESNLCVGHGIQIALKLHGYWNSSNFNFTIQNLVLCLPACLLEIFTEVIRPCYPCFWKTIAIVRPTEIPQFSPNICSSVDCRIHTIHICNQANNINKFEAQTPYHRKWFASRASLDSLSVLVWCILTMGQKRFS